MLNRIILIGRLTRDPESSYTQGGVPHARFTIAVDRLRRNPDTNERETDFIDIVAWRAQAEFAHQYLRKGRLVAVEGRLQIRSWTAQDGSRRKTAEVIADSVQGLDRPRDAESEEAAPPAARDEPQEEFEVQAAAPGVVNEALEDDPFEEDPFRDV